VGGGGEKGGLLGKDKPPNKGQEVGPFMAAEQDSENRFGQRKKEEFKRKKQDASDLENWGYLHSCKELTIDTGRGGGKQVRSSGGG